MCPAGPEPLNPNPQGFGIKDPKNRGMQYDSEDLMVNVSKLV
jgi:hypothetical protein